MLPGILVVTSLLFPLFLCVCKGAIPRGKHSNRLLTKNGRYRSELYSPNEERLIIDELISNSSTYCYINTWPKIATAFEKKQESDSFEFSQKRTAEALARHFFVYTMKDDRPEDAVKVPDSVKKMVRKPRKRFTKQEDEFMNEQLWLAPAGTALGSLDFWTDVAKQHKEIWRSGNKHFPVERTTFGLARRFLRMTELDRIKDKVKRKHAEYFYFNKGSSGKSLSKVRKLPASKPVKQVEDNTKAEFTDKTETDTEFCDFLEKELEEVSDQVDSDRELCDLLEKELEEASGRKGTVFRWPADRSTRVDFTR